MLCKLLRFLRLQVLSSLHFPPNLGHTGFGLATFLSVLLSGCAATPSDPSTIFTQQIVFTVSDGQTFDDPLTSINDEVLAVKSELRANTVEIQLKLNPAATIREIISVYDLKKIAQWEISELGVMAIVVESQPEKVDETVAALKHDKRIASVESVKRYELLSYNDPYFHLQGDNVTLGIEQVHEVATGKSVTVGIVDTGVDRQHPELNEKIVYAKNFVDHDEFDFDNDEHGTAVAGVIVASANNEMGIVGLAPDAELMVFKSCSQENFSRKAYCDSVSLMKALLDVARKSPDVLNLSLAGPEDELLAKLIEMIIAKGTIVIAAVNPRKPELSFPANMDKVVAVYAPGQMFAKKELAKSIVAPGLEVLTTTPGATYAYRSGSSMASAYVAGIATLLLEQDPELTTESLMSRFHLMTSQAIPYADVCQAVSGSHICDPETWAAREAEKKGQSAL